jgi:Domain of unknown function (DUF222)/HNH endonuclease
VRAIGEFDRSGSWAAENFVSTASAVRAKLRCSHGHAHRLVRLARKLERLPETSAAFGAGEITGEHVDEITRPYTPERAEMLEGIEAELVEFGRISTPGEPHDAVKKITNAFDGDGGAKSDERARAQQGDIVRDVRRPRDLERVVRSGAHRSRADRARCGDGSAAPKGRDPHLTSIACGGAGVDRPLVPRGPRRQHGAGSGSDAREHRLRHRRPRCQRPCARRDGPRGRGARATLSRTTLERMMCDCVISRMTDGRSNILDVGRATRTVGNSSWTALIVRDGHCTEEGCTLGPAHCEAHHVWHWENGGPTDLDNLVLLCWYHHKQRHIRDAKRGNRSPHSRSATCSTAPAPVGTSRSSAERNRRVAQPRT